METDFARQFDLQSFVSDGKTGHLRKVFIFFQHFVSPKINLFLF